jgi:predicted DNA-binding transcriptional regulator AlpA
MKILRQAEQAARLGCSRWTVRRIAATDPSFPAELEVSPGIRGVAESDFDAWIRSRPQRVRPKAEAAKTEATKTGPLHDEHVKCWRRAKRAAK